MYRLSEKERHNKPLHNLLNNGYKYALISSTGAILKTVRYSYQLETMKKGFPNSCIKPITELLK